jgi:hypothetical protein
MALKKRNNEDASEAKKEQDVFAEAQNNEKTTVSEDTVEQDNVEEEDVLPLSTVEKIIKETEERLRNQFDNAMRKMKLSKSKSELDEEEQYVEDLAEDWMDIPVVFFSYSINFSIHSDVRKGKEIKPPHGAVRFKPVLRTKRQGRKGIEVISVSSIKVHSKAVAEYLRNHSLFGISFFENMESAMNIDSAWAQKLIEANSAISRLTDAQVISRVRQENLPVSQDIAAMRKALTEIQAKRSMSRQDEILYGKLKKATIEDGREVVERKVNV